jgi:hypothetical protein
VCSYGGMEGVSRLATLPWMEASSTVDEKGWLELKGWSDLDGFAVSGRLFGPGAN